MRNRQLLTVFSMVFSVFVLLLTAVAPVDAGVFSCSGGDVACLIAAIETANSNGQANAIHLAAGTYTFTAPHDPAGLALPTVTGVITMIGAGPGVTVLAGDVTLPGFGLFAVETTATLTVQGLTVRGFGESSQTPVQNRGTATFRDVVITECFGLGVGAVLNEGQMLIVDSEVRNSNGITIVGGILNGGDLTIRRSKVEANFAQGTGGVVNTGRLTIIDSIVADNGAQNVAGIENQGTLRVSRSAIVGNSTGIFVFPGPSALSNGGTAFVENTTIANNRGFPIGSAGPLVLLNNTLADNVMLFAGTILGDERTQIQNTIIARNTVLAGPPFNDCSGPVTSLGNNIIGDPGDCTLLPTDRTGDAGLGVFANGVIPLLSTSQAIDAANTSVCPALDQRGFPRVDGNDDGIVVCDIGAAEFIDHVVTLEIASRGVFNARSRQKVTVDVLGGGGFDVRTIDPTTVRAGGTGHEALPITFSSQDVDFDGDLDVRFEFRASPLEISCDSPVVALTAKTTVNGTVAGSAEITSRNCKD